MNGAKHFRTMAYAALAVEVAGAVVCLVLGIIAMLKGV